VTGYFTANADGDLLVVCDPTRPARGPVRLAFPRQPGGERLSLVDYFRPLVSSEPDLVALQAVSAGPRAGAYVEALQQAGDYSRMLYVNGLASSTAEALAEYAHGLVRRELGLAATRGLRYSWGYAACPDLGEQRHVLELLEAGPRIGLSLSASDHLDPEHSTAAIVVHHPEAKYFSLR
jgi:5-methyltetrahydrofolate--homocysteine methyltransferase